MARILEVAVFAALLNGCAGLANREPNLAMPTDRMYMSEDCRISMDECMIYIGDHSACRKETGC